MTWGYLGTIVEWERVGMVVGLRNIVYCIPIQDCKDGSYFFLSGIFGHQFCFNFSRLRSLRRLMWVMANITMLFALIMISVVALEEQGENLICVSLILVFVDIFVVDCGNIARIVELWLWFLGVSCEISARSTVFPESNCYFAKFRVLLHPSTTKKKKEDILEQNRI